MEEYFEDNEIFTISKNRLLIIQTYSGTIPSMCPEFDPNPEEDYIREIIKLVNIDTGNILTFDPSETDAWKKLKALYSVLQKDSFENRAKILKKIWNITRDCTPYEILSAKLQRKRDLYNNVFPNINSKYFADISIDELKLSLDDMVLEYAQNMNDWKMYRDPVPEYYESNVRSRMKHIKKCISIKEEATSVS